MRSSNRLKIFNFVRSPFSFSLTPPVEVLSLPINFLISTLLWISFVHFRDAGRLGCRVFKMSCAAVKSQWAKTEGKFLIRLEPEIPHMHNLIASSKGIIVFRISLEIVNSWVVLSNVSKLSAIKPWASQNLRSFSRVIGRCSEEIDKKKPWLWKKFSVPFKVFQAC